MVKKKSRIGDIFSVVGKLLLCVVVVISLIIGGFTAQKMAETPISGTKPEIKYVFLFIGDGMGITEVKAAEKLLGEPFIFNHLAVQGVIETDNVDGEVTDSAAAATAMATGHKTKNGILGMSKDFSEDYETLMEQLKRKGWTTGAVTTTPINHATPAGFYAHTENRRDYYSIGLQALQRKTVDYLAGGAFETPDGEEGNLYDLAEQMGYTLLRSPADVTNAPEKRQLPIIAAIPGRDSGNYMEYEIDRRRKAEHGDATLSLPQLVENGISTLGMESKFFMVVESGMIDSALHKLDIGSAMAETAVLDQSVKKALDFAGTHKDETLIIVLSDHETSGFSLPAGNDIYLYKNQKISWVRFQKIIDELKDAKMDEQEAMARVKEYFGMGDDAAIPLNEEEKKRLSDAYASAGQKASGSDPFVNEVLSILAKKAKVKFTTPDHTGQPVLVYAQGVGQEEFGGWYENTEIYEKLKKLIID